MSFSRNIINNQGININFETSRIIKKHNLVAADVVELAPQLDPSGASSVLAAKVTRSLLMLLSI